jgi:hypothetical protein
MSRTRSDSYNARMMACHPDVEAHPQLLEDVGAFEKSVGNKPLFTREVLEQAAADVAKARKNEQVVVPHVLGNGTRQIWSGREWHAPSLFWTHSWGLAAVQGKMSLYSLTGSSWSTWSTSAVVEKYDLRPDDQSTNVQRQKLESYPAPVGVLDQMAELQSRILKHKVWSTITKLLVDLPVKVDNVVCLALGSLYLQPWTSSQHLLAICMADFLAAHYGSSTPLPILAFDPCYTTKDLSVLFQLPHPITIVSDPY